MRRPKAPLVCSVCGRSVSYYLSKNKCRPCRKKERLSELGPSACHPKRHAVSATDSRCEVCTRVARLARTSATCHPDRIVHKKGLCRDCFNASYRADYHTRRKPAERLRRYGLTPEGFAEIVERQGGEICAICAAPAVAIDHDHITGLVRGLLCTPCNMGLGHFRDSVSRMTKALAYMEAHAARHPSSVFD